MVFKRFCLVLLVCFANVLCRLPEDTVFEIAAHNCISARVIDENGETVFHDVNSKYTLRYTDDYVEFSIEDSPSIVGFKEFFFNTTDLNDIQLNAKFDSTARVGHVTAFSKTFIQGNRNNLSEPVCENSAVAPVAGVLTSAVGK